MKSAVVVASTFCFAIGHSALAADKDWFPKASDYCARFVLNLIDPSSHLVTPLKDPVIAKYVADFKIKTGRGDEEGEMGFLILLGYCNAHGEMKLGDAAPNALEDFVKFQNDLPDPTPQGPSAPQPPPGSTQREQAGEPSTENASTSKEST